MWVVVALVVVAVVPSPKFQAYEAIDPTGEVEAEALKVVGLPGVPDVVVKAAVGAWSGVMAIAVGPFNPPP